jgi:YhcH/YjgK/YiaL family protein
MIADNMQNCALYYGVHRNFEKAFAFIKTATAENYPVGRYEIDGDNLFALVQEYNTRLAADAKFEGHNRYIDIQYIISGTEAMKFADIAKMTVKVPYNETKDVTFYEDTDTSAVIVQDGEYAIFFPHDIHMPCLSLNETPAPARKIVVKVKL